MTPHEEEIWNVIDGLATPEEQKKMEARLREAGELRQEMATSKALHEALRKMPLEEPSLRFSQNLMEKLSKLNPVWKIKPLVAGYWEKLFLALFSTAFLLVTVFGISGIRIKDIPFVVPAAGLTNPFQGNFPFMVTVIMMSLCGALLCLLWLDRRLQKRFRSTAEK